MSNMNYQFDIPKHHRSIIKVIGVGGGGSNAVNHMFNLGIKDVEFVVCNTDEQALQASPVPQRLQIGGKLTDGLGAGANPEVGEKAALENKEEIRDFLQENTRMVFITAGMGGGTGTGAAPVIASIARDLDILTVGIVTVPFGFEGKKKMKAALAGVEKMKKYCDTVLVILNDKLREIFGNLSISTAFAQADNVLTSAAKAIAEIITVSGYVNVDFEDVKTVMKSAGAAVMGSGEAEGENRSKRAAETALSSPLLNNRDILGAEKILLSIVSGEEEELSMDELTIITEYIQEQAGEDAEMIFGHGVDAALGKAVRVTVIATGFEAEEEVPTSLGSQKVEEKPAEPRRTVFDLESSQPISKDPEPQAKPKQFEFEWRVDQRPSQQNEQQGQEQPSFRFEGTSRPVEEEEEDRSELYRDLENEYEIVDGRSNTPKTPDHNQEPEDDRPVFDPTMDNKEYKREQLLEQARRRVRALRANQAKQENEEEIKEKLDMPAYLRRNVKLQDVPHSSEPNISKYHLNDDNQITGQNRWLHDNVD